MNRVPIVTVGSLVRDIIYIKNVGDGRVYLADSRGGGSSWNALANASVKGARTLALCVGGYDDASRLCLDDLQSSGVTIKKERLLRGKKTRTIHEILKYDGVRQIEPKHECKSICPICLSETYNKGTAQLSQKIMMYFKPILKNYANDGIIVHIDSLNEYRLNAIKSLRIPNILISIDLGRLTNLRRFRKEDASEVLRDLDIIFINSNILPKLKKLSGFLSEEDLLKQIDARLLISLQGTKGIKAWVKSSKGIISFEQNALGTEYIIDTLGAGDAFIGSFLSTIANHSFKDFRTWLEETKDIEETVYSSQQWAAEKCKFLGGRGHIKDPYGKSIKWDFGDEIFEVLQPIEELKIKNEGLNRCRICGFDIKRIIEINGFDQNSNKYSECNYKNKKYKNNLNISQARLEVLIFPRNVCQLIEKIKCIWPHRYNTPWSQIFELSGPGYVIGSGGSFVVASYIAQLISSKRKAIAIPSRPFDFIRTGSDVAFSIFISSSGSTPDIMGAIRHAKDIGIPKLMLITGNKRLTSSEILREIDDVLLCTGANEERGFLSVLGVIAPCFFSWAAQSDKIWNDDNGYKYFNNLYLDAENRVNRIFSKYKRNNQKFEILGRRSIILGGGYAWPAMLDLESKMVESDFGRPSVSEIKDYSHGRFVSSMDKDVLAIVLGMPDDFEYRKFLIERLNHRSNDVIEIYSNESGPTGSLDLILQVEHLMRSFAEKEIRDISKPKIPPSGLELYKYREKPFML